MTETLVKLFPPPADDGPPPAPPAESPTGFRIAAVATGAAFGIATLLIDWFVGRLLG